MSKISQQDIAELLSVSRPNLKKWMVQPDLMPICVYNKMQALGIDIKTQEWSTTPCEFCGGKGYRLTSELTTNKE